MLHSIRRHVLPLDIYYSLKICHYRIAICLQDIIRGYNSLLTLVRLNLNIVPQDSNTIMKYVIQDLFITSSPPDHPPIKRLPLLNLLFLKNRITKEAFLPSIPKKSSSTFRPLHNTFEFFKKNIQHIY